MSKTFTDIVQETALIGIEDMEGARVSNVKYYSGTEHYDCTVSIDSHVVNGKNEDYDSLTILGDRLEDLTALLEDLGFHLAIIRQFNRVDREADDVLKRGIDISFHSD